MMGTDPYSDDLGGAAYKCCGWVSVLCHVWCVFCPPVRRGVEKGPRLSAGLYAPYMGGVVSGALVSEKARHESKSHSSVRSRGAKPTRLESIDPSQKAFPLYEIVFTDYITPHCCCFVTTAGYEERGSGTICC